jgi:ferrous-iron efflux pump FieF
MSNAALSPDRAADLMRKATYASVTAASVLILAKLGAWVLTDSVSLLSTLVDSMLDLLASLVNLFAVRQALVPADREHRFGHGKAEPLAALGQAAFVAGSAAFLVIEAGYRLIEPRVVSNSAIGIAVMVFAICVTLMLVLYQRFVIARTGSVAIRVDSLHYVGDLLINGSVILALVLSVQLNLPIMDPIFAIAIAGYIFHTAWRIARESMDMLMDREFADDERDRIKRLVMEHHGVLGMHDLRTRTSGRDSFIQLHIELDPQLPLVDAHEISDQVEARLQSEYPSAEVIIHQDPQGYEDPPPPFPAAGEHRAAGSGSR